MRLNLPKNEIKVILFFAIFLVIYYFTFLTGRSFIWEDQLYCNYPAANYFARSIASGRFPFWFSGVRNGIPFYTDIGAAVFYPLNWLLPLFAFGEKLPFLVFQWYLVFHVFLGAVFIFLFLRENKISNPASLLGMMIFSFSGFMALQFIHPTFIQTFIWFPLQLLFVKKIFGGETDKKYYFYLIIFLLISFSAGCPQTALYNTYFLIFYWLFNFYLIEKKIFSKKMILEILKIAALILVTILLGALIFLPSFQNWFYSNRQSFGFKEVADQSLPFYYLIHFLIPNFFGTSHGCGNIMPFWGFNKDTLEYAFWYKGYWQYWEFGSYAGQISLIAFFVFIFNFKKIKRRKEIIFFVFMAIFSLWFMLGRYGGLFSILYRILPGVAIFRTPSRISANLDFSLAVLAAFFIDILYKKTEIQLKKPLIVTGIIYLVFFAAIFIFGALFRELLFTKIFIYSLSQIIISFLLFTGISFFLYIILKKFNERQKITGFAIIVFLTFFDLFLAFANFHKGPINPDDCFADQIGLISQIKNLKGRAGPFRFAQMRGGEISEELIYPRNMAYLYDELEVPEGYILFGLKDTSKFQQIKNTRAKLDLQNVRIIAKGNINPPGIKVYFYPDSLPRVKFYTKIKKYSANEAIFKDLESGKLDYKNKIGVLAKDVENFKITGFLNKINNQVRLIKINPEKSIIDYDLKNPGIIFVSETYYPGWEVVGKNFKIIEVFGTFKGIVIPGAGQGQFILRFYPKIFKISLAISAGTLIILLAVIFLLPLHRRR